MGKDDGRKGAGQRLVISEALDEPLPADLIRRIVAFSVAEITGKASR